MWARREHVGALEKAAPTDQVRLLGNFDQYVLGPASGSSAFIPAKHKAEVSRTAGWISRVVVHRGRVVGVWEPDPDSGEPQLTLWGDVPRGALDAEAKRVGASSPPG